MYLQCQFGGVNIQFCTFTVLFIFLYFYVSVVCFNYLLGVDFISFKRFRIRSVFGYLSTHLSYIIAFSCFACFECYKVPGLLETAEKTWCTLKAH